MYLSYGKSNVNKNQMGSKKPPHLIPKTQFVSLDRLHFKHLSKAKLDCKRKMYQNTDSFLIMPKLKQKFRSGDFMNLIMGIFVFICGLIFGSFFNVCIFRIQKGESIAYPPSHCTSCSNELKWYDLVPVLSYVVLKGKCRYCKEKISLRYPIIELITGILFYLIFLKYGIDILTIKFIVFISLLIVIGMIDFDTTDVYSSTTITGMAAGVIFILVGVYYKIDVAVPFILGGLLGGTIIAIIILTTKGMGWGDAEICLLCGLFLGWKLTVVMLMLSFVLGGIVGMLLIALKIKGRKDYIAFGPFITIAAMITVFLGQNMINYYFSIMIR